MQTIQKISKYKLLWLLLPLMIFGCKSDEDEAEFYSRFTGNFPGYILFQEGNNELSIPNGIVEVSHNGEFFDFHFSDNIPPILNLEMTTNPMNDVLLNDDADLTHLIRITSNTLQIIYIEGDNYWYVESIRE
ncbi:MAG: hypothetical protein WDA08_00010 [Weeksellaceae bacterium]